MKLYIPTSKNYKIVRQAFDSVTLLKINCQ